MFRSLAELAFIALKNESFERLSGSSKRISSTDHQLTIEGVTFPSRLLLNKIGFLWTEIAKSGKVTGHFVHLNFIEFESALHTVINGLDYPANRERQRFCLAFACGLVSQENEFANNLLNLLRKEDDPTVVISNRACCGITKNVLRGLKFLYHPRMTTVDPALPTPDILIDNYFRKRIKPAHNANEGLFRGETYILSSFDCGTLALAVHEAQREVKLSIIPNLQDCTIKLRGKTNYSSLELQAIVYFVAKQRTALEIDEIEIKKGSSHTLETIGQLTSWVHNQQLTPQIKVGKLSVKNTPEEKVKESVVAGLKLVSDISRIDLDEVEIKRGRVSCFIWKSAIRWTSEIQIIKLIVHGLEDGLKQTVADTLARVTQVERLCFNERSGSRPSDLPPVTPSTVSHLASLASTTCTFINMSETRMLSEHAEVLAAVGRSAGNHKVQTLRLVGSDIKNVKKDILALVVPAVNTVSLSSAKFDSEQMTAILAAIPLAHPLQLKRLELQYLDFSKLKCGVVSRGLAAVEEVVLYCATLTRDQVLHILTYIEGNECKIKELNLSYVEILHGDWNDEDIKTVLTSVKAEIEIEGP